MWNILLILEFSIFYHSIIIINYMLYQKFTSTKILSSSFLRINIDRIKNSFSSTIGKVQQTFCAIKDEY